MVLGLDSTPRRRPREQAIEPSDEGIWVCEGAVLISDLLGKRTCLSNKIVVIPCSTETRGGVPAPWTRGLFHESDASLG